MTKRILVIGGSGFLGTAIIEELFNSGFSDITCGDITLNDTTRANQIHVDLLNLETLEKVLTGYDIVVNCAGQVSDPFNLCFMLNSTGMFNLAEVLSRQNTHLFQISTVAVYGSGETCSEESKLNPETNYAASKAFAESILTRHIKPEKLTILRLSNLYGASQQKGVIAYLIRSFHSDRKLFFNNSGDLKRYYLHINDCVCIIVSIIKNKTIAGIYNLVGEQGYSIKQLIALIENRFNMIFKTEYSQTPAWENVDRLIGEKIQAEIKYRANWKLSEFIERELKNA